ncbi:MAG: (d)CMP kinase [Bacteroidetes bacterium]|nr:(d)CMP kinase [Bacteroidota bacterium]MCZ6899082.1 (d)CMP kinase [Bacteroidota bacterium]
MKKIVVAIDGYSACGKSTTAKAAARNLGYKFIDTGAMYRAVTLYFYQNHIEITNPKQVLKAMDSIQLGFVFNTKSGKNQITLNGLMVENEIRQMHISESVSEVSAVSEVRKDVISQQRQLGKKRGVVMEGRDIGTVVFPDAELKIFMTANLEVRATRRQKELLEIGQMVELDKVIQNIQKRDHLDTTRKESPLVKAEDAYELDTTHMTLEEQIEEVIRLSLCKIRG